MAPRASCLEKVSTHGMSDACKTALGGLGQKQLYNLVKRSHGSGFRDFYSQKIADGKFSKRDSCANRLKIHLKKKHMGSGCFGSKRSKKIMERHNKKGESTKKKKPAVEKKERTKMRNSVKSITNYLNRRKVPLKLLSKAFDKYSNQKSEATAAKLAAKETTSQENVAAIIEATGAIESPAVGNTGPVEPEAPVLAAVKESTAAANVAVNNDPNEAFKDLYNKFVVNKTTKASDLTKEGQIHLIGVARALSKQIRSDPGLTAIMDELLAAKQAKREKKKIKTIDLDV